MRYLTGHEIIRLHERLIAQSGGTLGVRDLGAIESAAAQPRAAFGGKDLYPKPSDKAACLGYSLIANHPFIDGNKRVGHAALCVFLLMNGHTIDASVDEQEQVILGIAAGQIDREAFAAWVAEYLKAV